MDALALNVVFNHRCEALATGGMSQGAMRYRNDPAGMRLPIKLDTATNGE